MANEERKQVCKSELNKILDKYNYEITTMPIYVNGKVVFPQWTLQDKRKNTNKERQ